MVFILKNLKNNNMKIELKHLAPYLPYGLKCKSTTILFGEEDNGVYEMGLISMRGVLKGTGKPILRPLSDLKENLELKENLYKSHKINMYWHKWEALENKNNYKELEYLPKCIFDMLVENHFDVFGLIEKGLAIDINTIKQ